MILPFPAGVGCSEAVLLEEAAMTLLHLAVAPAAFSSFAQPFLMRHRAAMVLFLWLSLKGFIRLDTLPCPMHHVFEM
jgi:hypothetical protein